MTHDLTNQKIERENSKVDKGDLLEKILVRCPESSLINLILLENFYIDFASRPSKMNNMYYTNMATSQIAVSIYLVLVKTRR